MASILEAVVVPVSEAPPPEDPHPAATDTITVQIETPPPSVDAPPAAPQPGQTDVLAGAAELTNLKQTQTQTRIKPAGTDAEVVEWIRAQNKSYLSVRAIRQHWSLGSSRASKIQRQVFSERDIGKAGNRHPQNSNDTILEWISAQTLYTSVIKIRKHFGIGSTRAHKLQKCAYSNHPKYKPRQKINSRKKSPALALAADPSTTTTATTATTGATTTNHNTATTTVVTAADMITATLNALAADTITPPPANDILSALPILQTMPMTIPMPMPMPMLLPMSSNLSLPELPPESVPLLTNFINGTAMPQADILLVDFKQEPLGGFGHSHSSSSAPARIA